VVAEPPPGSIDSTAVVRALAAGDEAAFATFYGAWFAPTLALARAVSRRDEAFCLDVVQDVMFAVARKMPALGSAAAVAAWMARTVRHAVLDRLRSERRRGGREGVAAAELARAASPEPWELLVATEQQAWLRDCLAELPAADRALLAARFDTSTTVTATGADFGLGADAAHGRLRRVMARLRQAAAEWWHG